MAADPVADMSSTGKAESASKSAFSNTDKPKTSSSAFASSGFASLANATTSPFGSLGASKPSVFGGGAHSTGFGSFATSKPTSATSTTTTSGFGALSGNKPTIGFGFGSGTSSGFGGLSSGSAFGSKLGNGFAGGSGPKLSTFAAPVKEVEDVAAKPAKAFGAPESDEDSESDDEDSGEGATGVDDDEGFVGAEDKKKSKLAKGMMLRIEVYEPADSIHQFKLIMARLVKQPFYNYVPSSSRSTQRKLAGRKGE